MRKKLLVGLATGLLIFCISIAGVAYAIPITVSQGGAILGTIESYSGSLTGTANYNYYRSSNHVINGPTAETWQGQIFFYEGSDGLSFNTVFGSTGSGPLGYVNWDITIAGSTTDPSVLVSDDRGELRESSTNNIFNGRWHYYQHVGDGGVIGELSGNAWSITINQLLYTNVTSLKAYGATNAIPLSLDISRDIILTAGKNPIPVPEPATILLLATALVGLAGTRIRRKDGDSNQKGRFILSI